MRKVKVAAAFLSLLGFGMIGSVSYQGSTFSVAHANQSAQLLELTEEPVTTTASIETTDVVRTTTAAATTKRPAQTIAKTRTTVNQAKSKSKLSLNTTAATTSTTVTSTTVTTEAEETTSTSASGTEFFETTAPASESSAAPQTVTVSESQSTTDTTATTYTEPVTLPESESEEEQSHAITVTDREYIMLCNVVGHEYGSDFVPVEEKALVAEVIMNRVNSPLFPNTIYEVLTQPNQFAGLEYLIEMDTMSSYVTPSVREAVDLYLAHPEQFDHGYLFFNGDGTRNYFRCSLSE